jgi:thiosulfate dehydrogenase [quinone] large subunit
VILIFAGIAGNAARTAVYIAYFRYGMEVCMATTTRRKGNVYFQDPPFIVDLFNNTRWAWLWLILRLYLGYSWLTSGLEKLGNPGWTQTGQALAGFWKNATQVPNPPARPPIAFEWYRSFIVWMLNQQSYTWFSKLIVAGEILIGIALILGTFVGISAFFGAFMNWNFMMAGSASINPLMFLVTIFLIMAWKTAGWIGLDRWLLPAMGTPWQPGERLRMSPGALPVTGPHETTRGDLDMERSMEDPDMNNDVNTRV